MKFYIAAAALPVLVSSFNMGTGGFRYNGSPEAFVSRGRVRVQGEGSPCGPGGSWQAAQQQQQKEWVDRAFEELKSEFNGTPDRRRRAQEGREDVVDRVFEQLETEFSNNFETPNRRRRAQRSEDVVNNRDKEEDKARQQMQLENLRKQQEWVNRAFGLAAEVASSSGRDVKETKNEAAEQQQEWLNRAFGLATEVASDIASSSSPRRDVKEAKNEAVQQQHEEAVNRDDEKDEAFRQQQVRQQQVRQQQVRQQQQQQQQGEYLEAKKEAVRQQQEWLNQAFGLATNVASGLSSPRYEVNDGNDAFQVALDVPGVKASDIDISFNEDDSVLKVSGKRDIGAGGATRTVKFSKSFSLDSSVVDKDKISAQINNGVLLVTAPKAPIENKEKKVRKITVVEVGPENVNVQGPAGSAAKGKPSPGSEASQTAEEPTDGKKKDDEKPNPEKV
jgi:HSP20 family molecular chaperone IbpA